MNDGEKILRVQAFLGNDANATTAVVSAFLASAKDTIIGIMYQFDDEPHELPARYDDLQCKLAARYFARMGGLGEITHSEGGIQRQWASADDADLLKKVRPIIKAV